MYDICILYLRLSIPGNIVLSSNVDQGAAKVLQCFEGTLVPGIDKAEDNELFHLKVPVPCHVAHTKTVVGTYPHALCMHLMNGKVYQIA